MAVSVSSDLADALGDARRQTRRLIAPLTSAELEAVHDPLMSPLVWDLGHIAAYEDLWINHRHGGHDLLRAELADLYDAFETPRAARGDIPFLRHEAALEYLAEVRERALAVLTEQGAGDGTLFEMVIRHEAQHNETMRQTLFLAGLPGGVPSLRVPSLRVPSLRDGIGSSLRELPARVASLRELPAGVASLRELPARVASLRELPARVASLRELPASWMIVPAGGFEMGCASGFGYDNEKPAHRVEVAGFRIMRRPVTNATWLTFAEGGGYERREWWSDEGWAWKEEYDITHPEGWGTGRSAVDEGQPVMHVSWFEADALARAHGARLPTEAEWERAATWEQEPLQQTGAVWEWTATRFDGYPGFEAFPYPEYSEVFFGERYRVLRGGSWATGERVRSTTFRNWDLPERRQIFSGVRLVKDEP